MIKINIKINIKIMAIILITSVFCCACAQAEGPREVVEKTLNYYKTKNYTEFNKRLTHTIKDFDPNTTDKSATVLDMFSNIEYEIKDVRIEGSVAEVRVSVTSIAIRDLISDFITITINLQLAGELSEDEEEMRQQSDAIFDTMITDPDLERHTEDVVILLEKYDNSWKIITSGDYGRSFVNAMTCFQYGAEGSENRQRAVNEAGEFID